MGADSPGSCEARTREGNGVVSAHLTFWTPPAAERRQRVAHSVSCGCGSKRGPAPDGATEPSASRWDHHTTLSPRWGLARWASNTRADARAYFLSRLRRWDTSPAAERRKMVAHSVSCGCGSKRGPAPDGATETPASAAHPHPLCRPAGAWPVGPARPGLTPGPTFFRASGAGTRPQPRSGVRW